MMLTRYNFFTVFASIFLMLIIATFSHVSVALAETQTSVVGAPQQVSESGAIEYIRLFNPLGEGTSLETLLGDILQLVIRIGSIVIVLMIVFVGYKFVVAQGNSGKIEEARRMLLWTVVGALILLGAEAIALGIQATVQAISTGN